MVVMVSNKSHCCCQCCFSCETTAGETYFGYCSVTLCNFKFSAFCIPMNLQGINVFKMTNKIKAGDSGEQGT